MIPSCTLDERDYCTKHRRYHAGHHRKWALGNDERSIKMRQMWDSMAGISEPLPLNPVQQARSYISTLSQHVLNGSKTVPDEIREQRHTICNGCDKRDPVKNACKVCGCKLEKTFLGDKLAWAVSSCPLGKWQAYHENPPETGGISGVEKSKVDFGNSIRFDHENLHPEIPGIRFNSSIIEQV